MKFSCIMKAIGSPLLILLPFLSADAARLTPEQALRRLEGSTARFRIPGNATYRLAYTESAVREPRLYVFNKGDRGFVIASADDELPPILGYSENGAFDPSDASPELKWWLSQYAGEAAWYLNNPDGESPRPAARGVAPSRTSRPDIPELLTSKWNQDSPYNLACPDVGGRKCVTGCVATAMAQVIRYHGYPAQGSENHSYSWNGRTLDFNYGATVFDYADMLDWYDEGATPAQQQAVASLMYACGVGVDMSYSPDESVAGDMYIPYALKTFFNYDASTRLLKRNCFSTEEWEDMVYGELEARRPVIYGGQAPNGGHQFVCDGYENGYFHINWGWAGMGDGYFLLSALDPGLQGIGGFAGGYNSDQAMVCGAAPAQGGTPWYPIYATGGLEVTQVYDGNFVVALAFKNGSIYNYSPEAVDLSFYLKCVSESGHEFMSENPMDLQFRGASGLSVDGYSGFSIYLPTDLEEGNYKVSLGFKTPEGNWQDVLFPLSVASYFNISVDSDGKYVFAEGTPEVKSKVKVTAFAPSTTVLSGVPTKFDMTIENIGEVEFSNSITIKVYEKGNHNEPLAVNGVRFTLAAGEVFNGWLELTYSLADGEYDVIVYDNYDEVISNVFTLVIGERPVSVSRILLDTTEASIEEGSDLQLVATVLPEDASDKSLIWSSSDSEVANVDQTGLVTAFTEGKAIITVKSAADEDISASCQITVKAKVIEATGITIDMTEATLTEGETLTLAAKFEPDATTDKTLTWSSSDEEVAAVDENGVVTALKPGTAKITVSTSNGKTASCEIIVEAKVIVAEGIALDVTEATLTEGETLTLTATVEPDETTDNTLTWSSSDEEVATVDENGVVTALKPGTATITVSTLNGKTSSCEITVEAKVIEADGIELDVREATLTEDEKLTLTATIDPETVTDKTLTWSSSDEEVATVEDGVVTALKPGTATITVSTSNGKTASCEITVKAKVIEADGVALDVTEATLTEGESLTLTATVDPDETTDKTLTWSSSDEEVATVDENGVVTALKPGTATITVSTLNGKTSSCEITVEAKVIEADGIELDVREATLTEDETLTLTATIDPETVTDKTLTWSSSDEEVATVEDGVVTALKPGTATITVSTSNGKTASCEITVKAKVIEADGVALDVTEATLTEGESLTLTATVDPDETTDKTLTWSSSDEEVATVDENGVVTALKPGTATITVSTSNGKTASCEVTVEAKVIVAEGIALDVTEATLTEGESLTLTATVEPDETTDKTLTWSSSDEEVATVEDGVVTALKPGTTTITASTSNGKTASCEITVEAKVIVAEGIALDVTEATLTEGESLILTATVKPDETTDKTLTWSSSDEEVATVDENGVVTALKPGKATITVSTSNGKTASCEITVEAKVIEADGIALDVTEATLTEGDTLTLTATIDPETVTDKSLTWSSSDEEVATVDENGVVTALKPGTVTITVSTSNGKTALCEITVKAKVIEADGIELDVREATLTEDEKLTLTATIDPETVTDKTLTWSSSDEEVATVDENGVVTALKPGTAIITVSTSNGKTASCEIIVKAKVIEADGVALDVKEATLTEGETLTLTATVDPDETTDKTLTWSSSDEEVATVDENGVVTALKPGTATITASTSNGKTASCEIIVEAKVIEAEGIALDVTEATLTEGESLTLTATVDPDETTDKTLTWSSSDEEVATVDENGVVTALKPGTATITASTSNGKTASCEIIVEAKVIVAEGIALDVTETTLTEGESLTLTATVDPDETTDKTLTWSSSDDEVATVDENGVVTALKPGTATITVSTSNGKTASCEIIVEAKVIVADGIALDVTEATLTEGESLTLTAIIEPAETTDKTLTWSSSDEEVATVDENGVVTALKPGTSIITVSTSNGKTASCEIQVIEEEPEIIYVTSVYLDRTDIEAVPGTVITLVATVLPEDATDKELLWSSSDEEVASVDQDGTVTIHSAGSAVITAQTTDGSEIKAECHISGVSLLDAIESDDFKADVYTFDGLLIKSDADGRDISNLAKGSYIIRVGSKTHKIIK